MKIMQTKYGEFRGKRAELNVYDDANITFDVEYMINKFHKDQDGVTVVDDFRIMGMSVVEDEI